MPLADYRCETCGRIQPDVYFPSDQGACAHPPVCCDRLMDWIPAVGAMDAYEPGQEFQVRDGRNQLRTVESLREIRKIERESEQQARNGEGQRMVWRKYSQNASNVHVNTLGPDPAQHPERRFAVQRSAAVAAREYGPGVGDHNASALKE